MHFLIVTAFLLTIIDVATASSQDQTVLGFDGWRLVMKEDDYEFYEKISSKADGQEYTNNSIILNFDDVELSAPIVNFSKYHALNFTGFQLINPLRASEAGLISPFDIYCTTSSPNAIMGSRGISPPTIPRFFIPESLSSPLTNRPSYFTLDGFALKGMGYVPRGLSIWITTWKIVDGRAVDSAGAGLYYIREGYQGSPAMLNFKMMGWTKSMNVVEIHAQSPKGTDWEFCLDDIEISYV